jgi:hypothetical protein
MKSQSAVLRNVVYPLIISLTFLAACSHEDHSSKPNAISLLSQNKANVELTSIDLSQVWLSPYVPPSSQCSGRLIDFVEMDNARVEYRTMPTSDPVVRETLCILRRNPDGTTTKIVDTLVESASYHAVTENYDPASYIFGSWDCSDQTSIGLPKQQEEFGYIVIAIERYNYCEGDAGSGSARSFLTLFVDAMNPQSKTIAVPGLELTEQYAVPRLNDSIIKPIHGNLYLAQEIYCYVMGCDPSESVYVSKEQNKLVIRGTTGRITMPTFDPSIFSPNSYFLAGSPTDDPHTVLVDW